MLEIKQATQCQVRRLLELGDAVELTVVVEREWTTGVLMLGGCDSCAGEAKGT
jgi:hypothetical protein